MKRLTKAEEQIIQILWKLGQASTKEVRNELPEPKPAITTVSTVIRILESKGFVTHKRRGRKFLYYPLVQKEEYAKASLSRMITNYFDGSFKKMVSFFVEDGDMNLQELEEMIKEINQKEES